MKDQIEAQARGVCELLGIDPDFRPSDSKKIEAALRSCASAAKQEGLLEERDKHLRAEAIMRHELREAERLLAEERARHKQTAEAYEISFQNLRGEIDRLRGLIWRNCDPMDMTPEDRLTYESATPASEGKPSQEDR